MDFVKPFARWFAALFARVSHAPPRGVYRWQGRTSIITWLVAWIFALARFVSPLQWVKLIVRRGRQDRPDFHAADTEHYFLALLAFFLAWVGLEKIGWVSAFADWAPGETAIAKFFIGVFLFESFVWLSYYCLWRNFMEPNYTLYHPAEYLVLFPVIVGVQVLAIGRLLSVDAGQVAGWMLGGVKNEDYPLGLMGWFYIAILLSNLRGMIPRPNFKRNANTLVIGAGDVALRRLLPAMKASMTDDAFRANVAVVTVEDGALGAAHAAFDVTRRDDTNSIIAEAKVGAGAAIVATPSDRHMCYVKPLVESGIRVVCEKPLTSVRAEIDELSARRGVYRDSLFALSYYVLEKALPLTLLLEGNGAFLKYLKIEHTDAAGTREVLGQTALDRVQSIRAALGEPAKIAIDLIEGVERSPTAGARAWTEAPGGLIFETGIHPILLMVKAQRALAPGRWTNVGACLQSFKPRRTCASSVNANKPGATTLLRLRQAASNTGPEIDLIIAKYAPESAKRRGGVITCARGKIAFDFDSKSLTAKLDNQAQGVAISVRDEFSANYAVQTDLALRFIKDGWGSVRYDDFDDQIDVLSWMSLRAAAYESGAQFTYGAAGRQTDFDNAIA